MKPKDKDLGTGELAVSSAAPKDVPARNVMTRRMPGEEGIWVVVVGDLAVFTLLFFTYLYYRAFELPVFLEGRAVLDRGLGLLNTLLLLTSSLFVALGLRSVRMGNLHAAIRLLSGAIFCGVGFVVVKSFEWTDKIEHGYTVASNDFFMLYYVLTGIHLFHVFVGIGVLGILMNLVYRRARRGETIITVQDRRLMESCGIFWHVVDLLWIVLFALFYLVV